METGMTREWPPILVTFEWGYQDWCGSPEEYAAILDEWRDALGPAQDADGNDIPLDPDAEPDYDYLEFVGNLGRYAVYVVRCEYRLFDRDLECIASFGYNPCHNLYARILADAPRLTLRQAAQAGRVSPHILAQFGIDAAEHAELLDSTILYEWDGRLLVEQFTFAGGRGFYDLSTPYTGAPVVAAKPCPSWVRSGYEQETEEALTAT